MIPSYSRIDPISEKLSYLSLKNEVSWNEDLIDNQRNWWIFKIQKLKQNKLRFRGEVNLQRLTILEAFPEWKITFNYLETQATTEELKTFYNLAKPFFSPSKFYANDIKCCPFTSALTVTSGVVQIRGSNGFGQFWPFMGCWGRLPLGCMHTNFGAHWAPRGRAGVPLFFLLGEFCNGWFSSVCDIWEPILGGYGNHPWPLTNHHKKGLSFSQFLS